MRRYLLFLLLIAGLVAGQPAGPAAHEIPATVHVHGFVKPEGRTLRFLVRVPLEAMRDIDIPTRGPGYLDLSRVDLSLEHAATLWIQDFVRFYEGDTELDGSLVDARVSLPSDRSFETYETALAHVQGRRLPEDTELYWEQGMLDALFEYPIGSDLSRFSVHPDFERLGLQVVTVLRFLPPDGSVRAFELADSPGLVHLDPSWFQALFRFIQLGFEHILDGIDHLLFLFCLVIPFRKFRPLVLVVTSFTLAHSVTLIASAFNLAPDALWFPPLVETLIAASIVYMAFENIFSARLERRWLITFGFGLVHGFGFSFALSETLQFAGSHLLTSLVAFNVGVELGQLLVLALLVPTLDLLFRYGLTERVGTIVFSALVAHTGWHWMVERAGILVQYDFALPSLDAAFLASLLRWVMLLVIAAGLVWGLYELSRRGRQVTGLQSPAGSEEVPG